MGTASHRNHGSLQPREQAAKSVEGCQRRSSRLHFSAQIKCKCDWLRNQSYFGGRNLCQIVLNKTASGVRSREKRQEGASSLTWGKATAGDPDKGWGYQTAPGDGSKDVSHFSYA